MTTIQLRELGRDNWRAALELAVRPEQQRFIADHAPIALVILAKAYVRSGGLIWTPHAIYADELLIGLFALAATPQGSAERWLYHFFIDARHQGRGHGKQALQALVRMLQEQRVKQLTLTVHPENHPAQALYQQLGFQATGKVWDGELVYRMRVGG